MSLGVIEASSRNAALFSRSERHLIRAAPSNRLALTDKIRPTRPLVYHTARYLSTQNVGGVPFGSGLQSVNSPTTYFQRSSLPANTIIRFVPQQTAWIVERMGKFHRILQPGLAILIPVIDKIAYVKSLKESALEIPSQSAITADNVTLELDGVLYTRIFNAYKAR